MDTHELIHEHTNVHTHIHTYIHTHHILLDLGVALIAGYYKNDLLVSCANAFR